MLTLELLKKELAVATLQQKLGKEVNFYECVVYFNLSVLQTVCSDMSLQGSMLCICWELTSVDLCIDPAL